TCRRPFPRRQLRPGRVPSRAPAPTGPRSFPRRQPDPHRPVHSSLVRYLEPTTNAAAWRARPSVRPTPLALLEGEGGALGVAADRPALAGVDDRAAEVLDLTQGAGHVGDREVGERGGVAGAAAALVDADPDAARVGDPAGALPRPALGEVDFEQAPPEAQGALGVVGGVTAHARH